MARFAYFLTRGLLALGAGAVTAMLTVGITSPLASLPPGIPPALSGTAKSHRGEPHIDAYGASLTRSYAKGPATRACQKNDERRLLDLNVRGWQSCPAPNPSMEPTPSWTTP